MAEAALKIRRNAEEYRDAVSDLLVWEKEMIKKDKQRQPSYPPIRSIQSETTQISTHPSSTAPAPIHDQKIKGFNYAAWEKFDVDKALEQIDYQPASKPVQTPVAHLQPNSKDRIPQEALSRLESALVEKEKGNEYFKRKNFKRAVQCYTKSIELNPADTVPIINRAMAHIKLFNWVKAESDCSLGLEIQPKNVKALWRRGIARRELGKFELALQDLEMAMVLEPANTTIKQELQGLKKAMEAQNPVALKPTTSAAVEQSAQVSRRRRLVIQEVGDAPVSAKPIKLNPAKIVDEPTLARSISPAAEQSFTEAAQPSVALPNTQTVKTPPAKPMIEVMNISDVPDIKTFKSSVVIMDKNQVSTKTAELLKVPKTMFEYARDWKSLGSDLAGKYTYFKAIAPSDLPNIFKSSLEAIYFCGMLEILYQYYLPNESVELILETLASMTRIERVQTAVMFLSKKDKQVVMDLVKHIEASVLHDKFTRDLIQIKSTFKIK
ncbi:hypothetical protein BDV3_005417 [Batrachochytrium dendrobatidis]